MMSTPQHTRASLAAQKIARQIFLVGVLVASIAAQTREARAQVGVSTPSSSPATLKPGDVIRLRIYREPDLSGEFMVNEHGEVTLPRLGPRSVIGQPIDSVRASVIRGYAEYLRDATIELTPLYRVRVTGAVRSPGIFTIDPTMSVADAVGLAGGVSTQGREGRVVLLRDGRPVANALSPGLRLVELALRSGDELNVPERAWISRNAGLAIGALSATASILWAIRR